MAVEPELPIPQDEARRRLLAAVALHPEIASVESLGSRTGFSSAAWKRVGIARHFKPRHAESAARALGVPYEWFTVPDLAEAVRVGAAQPQEETPAASGVERSELDEIFEDPRAEGADREHGGSTR